LELHNNNISKISLDVLNFLRNATNLTLLSLHENPWICDCNTIDFLSFIRMQQKIITDLRNVTCYGKNELISNMTMTDFCLNYVDNNEEQSYRRHILFFVLYVFVIIIISIISISGLFCYMYQSQLKKSCLHLRIRP
jgi:hypothetical protein